MSPDTIAYAGPDVPHGSNWWSHPTPEQQRFQVKLLAALTAVGTLAYWIGLFVTCRPALELFCFGPFMPWVFTGLWTWTAAGSETIYRQTTETAPRRRFWAAGAILCFFLALYSLVRADNDVFSLAVRQRILAAGGPEQIRREWTDYRRSLPAESNENPLANSMPLHNRPAGGGAITPKSKGEMPPGLYALQQDLGPFLRSRHYDTVLYFDGIVSFNDFSIEVVPLNESTGRGRDLWDYVSGGRREIYDGIWIDVEIYNK